MKPKKRKTTGALKEMLEATNPSELEAIRLDMAAMDYAHKYVDSAIDALRKEVPGEYEIPESMCESVCIHFKAGAAWQLSHLWHEGSPIQVSRQKARCVLCILENGVAITTYTDDDFGCFSPAVVRYAFLDDLLLKTQKESGDGQ